MYSFVNLSNTFSPLNVSSMDQIMFSLPSPLFSISPTFVSLGDISNSNISSPDSFISTVGISKKVCATPEAAVGPVRNRRQRHEFCKVCEKNITEEGKRSQGPRRHILQHHLCRPIFSCPLCPATSNYDKAHIRTHMNRIHKGFGGEVIEVEKKMFAKEEERWFKRCFGEGAESRSNFIINEQPKEKDEFSVERVKKEVEVKIEEGVVKDNYTPSSIPSSPILFSIDRILCGRTHNL